MIRLLCLSLLLSLLLVGCRTPAETRPAPQATPTLRATRTPDGAAATPDATLPADDPVRAACDWQTQRQTLRDDGAETFDALPLAICYDLTFELGDAGNTFESVARVTLRNDSQDEWPDLLFRLYPAAPLLFGGKIEAEQVQVEGSDVAAQRVLDDDTGLLIPLDEPLAPGASTEVAIHFTGQLPSQIGGNTNLYGVYARTASAVTMASWFPLLAVWHAEEQTWYASPVRDRGDPVFSQAALIRAHLSAPTRFQLAVSGTIIEQREEGARTLYEVATGPARDMTMVWLDGYDQEKAVVDGTTLRHWYRPGDEAGGARAFSAARQSLALFNERFGPYPFEELEYVEVPLSGAGGVEYPQLLLLDAGLYQNPSRWDFLSFVSAHETAHQWWYSAVGNDVDAAPWQDEALTNWSTILWLEEAVSESVARDNLDSFEQSVALLEQQSGEEPISQPLENFEGRGNAYSAIVYLKGTLFFDALREEIGDEAYFAALSDYYATHRFAIAAPADLLGAFEAHSDRKLDAFYEEWGVTP